MGLRFRPGKGVLLVTAEELKEHQNTVLVNGAECWIVPDKIFNLNLDAALARLVGDTGRYELANIVIEVGGAGEGGRVSGNGIKKDQALPIVDTDIWSKNTATGTD